MKYFTNGIKLPIVKAQKKEEMDPPISIAQEAYYEALTPQRVYSHKVITMPKGEPIGFHSAVFLLTRSQEQSLYLLNSSLLDFRIGKYRYYYIDHVYREKIGAKKLIETKRKSLKEAYLSKNTNSLMRYMSTDSPKSDLLENNPNIVIDLGQWMEYFFLYRKGVTLEALYTSFINFFISKISLSSDEKEGYKKYIVIDVNGWSKIPCGQFRCSLKEDMNQPLTMLMAAGKLSPDLIDKMGDLTFILVDSINEKELIFPVSDFKKDRQKTLRNRFMQIPSLKVMSEEDVVTKEDILAAKAREIRKNEIRDDMKRQFVGNPEGDLTSADFLKQFEGDENEDETDDYIADVVSDSEDISETENDENDEILKNAKAMNQTNDEEEDDENIEVEAEINNIIEKEPEVLEVDANVVNARLEKILTNRYIRKTEPTRTPEQLKNIAQYSKFAETIVEKSTINDIKSKMIEEKKFDKFIDSNNPSILKSKFVNFDKGYMENKFESDLDAIIRSLENAEYPMYCVEKYKEDTSTQMNLKYTYTWVLKDINGVRQTIKCDIPIVIDNNYVFLKGSKKIIGHQLALLPIVKTQEDAVQIVCWYNKLFVYRKYNTSYEITGIKRLFAKEGGKYQVHVGNSIIRNKYYNTPVDFDVLAKVYNDFTIGDVYFLLDINSMKEYCERNGIDIKGMNYSKELVVGVNTKTKEPIKLPVDKTLSDIIMPLLEPSAIAFIRKAKIPKTLMFAQVKINNVMIPLILLLYYLDGFKSVMEKAKIEWKFIKFEEAGEYAPHEWGDIILDDGIIMWKRSPQINSMLMNGLQRLDLSLFSFDEMESKDTFAALLMGFYSRQGALSYIDQFKDFMIDDCTKELLISMGAPTDLIEIFIYAASLLITNSYKLENNMANMRIRGAEIIPLLFYKAVANSYLKYRSKAYKSKNKNFSINPDCVIGTLLSGTGTKVIEKSAATLIEEASMLNPVLTLEKSRRVSYKGVRGINMEKAMGLDKRGYDESMLGVLAITTSNDSNVGFVRQLTLEPNVVNTRGVIEVVGEQGVDDLMSANLFSPAEMLTPLSVQHDDPDRTAMTYKQSQYMVMCEDSDPTYIGNKVESIVPYHMPEDFSVMAKMNGKVIDYKENEYLVVQYEDKTYRTVDLSVNPRKNAAAGFYIESQFTTNLKMGDSFVEGQAIAWDPKAFKKNLEDRGLSMKLGVFAKVAVISNWDIFEDSGPCTKSLSNRMATVMIEEKKVSLSKWSFIDWMVKVGDKVNAGDSLIRFSPTRADEELYRFMTNVRDETKEEIIEDTMSTIHAHRAGEIVKIVVKTNIDPKDLDPSIQKVLKEYNSKLERHQEILDKYSNPGDSKYYKSGSIITDTPDIVELKPGEKLNGKAVDEGVVISIFVRYKDYIKKGDKICAEFALKGITSHIIEEGYEPWSELRPNEEISYLIAPLAISARKVPSVFLAMYGNKCIIELKRHHIEIWKGSGTIGEKKKKITDNLYTALNLLDPTGSNGEYYKKKFNAMSERDFSVFFEDFIADEKRGYYLEVIEFDRDLKIDNIKKCADFLKVPLEEYVALPYHNYSKEHPTMSVKPVPVGYIHMKRLQQTLSLKTHASIEVDKRNALTGQVIGEDKNARNSDVETYSLLALGAKNALKEFMGFRSDDMIAKDQANQSMSQNGYVYLKDLDNDPANKTTLNTLNAYFLLQGIVTNVLDPDRIDNQHPMKIKLCTDKWIKEQGCKQVTNTSYWYGRTATPTDDGLFSPKIFGTTQRERKTKCGYIDLKGKYFHPYVFEILTRIFPKKFVECASGSGAWEIINGNLVKITDPDDKLYNESNTGVEWLVNNFKRLELKKNASKVREKRINLIEELSDDELFISKWVVIPVFYRDVNTSKKNLEIPKETKDYQKLLQYANSIDPYGDELLNLTAKFNIQNLLLKTRKDGQTKIAKKNGFMHKSVMGKSIDRCSRNVISVPTLVHKKSPKDMDVDILHAGLPLATCIAAGYPLMMKWIMDFFNEAFVNEPYISIIDEDEDGHAEVTRIPTGDQLRYFTESDIKKQMKQYINTYSSRFAPVKIKLENGKEYDMAFAGKWYGDVGGSNNPSELSTRALTWTDVFYMAAMETLTDKHVYITRYPLVDYFGTYPSRVMPVSTVKTGKMIVNGKTYDHYPCIIPNLPEEEVETLFIDTIEISNLFLDAIGGDYDGDTVSVKMVYSIEANLEAEEIINHRKQYIAGDGRGVRIIGNEPYLTFFNMTKYED